MTTQGWDGIKCLNGERPFPVIASLCVVMQMYLETGYYVRQNPKDLSEKHSD